MRGSWFGTASRSTWNSPSCRGSWHTREAQQNPQRTRTHLTNIHALHTRSVATARSIVQRGLNDNNAEVLDFLVQLLLALGCEASVLPLASSTADLRALPLQELELRLACVAFRSRPALVSRHFGAVNSKLLRPAPSEGSHAFVGACHPFPPASTV